MSRWFRLYAEVAHNPKVQRLSPDLFKAWINLLCLASENDPETGRLPDIKDISFVFRLSNKRTETRLLQLIEAGLIVQLDNGYAVHNWEKRQYKSDTSAKRVAAHRRRKKQFGNVTSNEACNVTVTPPETETEAETYKPSIVPQGGNRSQARLIAEEFENKFWPTYPHRVGKAAAKVKFSVARSKASLAEILAGVRRYEATKPADRPWCNPATYLHQERWLDQPQESTLKPVAHSSSSLTAKAGPYERRKLTKEEEEEVARRWAAECAAEEARKAAEPVLTEAAREDTAKRWRAVLSPANAERLNREGSVQ